MSDPRNQYPDWEPYQEVLKHYNRYPGWEPWRQALMEAGRRVGQHVEVSPKYNYMRVIVTPPEGQAPDPVLEALGYAVEVATEYSCQLCGGTPATQRKLSDGLVYNACGACAEKEPSELPQIPGR
jgi:hypothetical protein